MLFSTVIKSFKSARRFDIELIYSCFQIDIECFVFKLRGVRGVVVSVEVVVSVRGIVVSTAVEGTIVSVGESLSIKIILSVIVLLDEIESKI
jgi:hypothetical protein